MNGLRVIVGDEVDAPRSQLWRIWTGDKSSDVYVGARSVAGEVRASLHESAKWRFAFATSHQKRADALVPPHMDRARHKWNRPAEFAPGLTRAFTIEVPSTELLTPEGPDPLKGGFNNLLGSLRRLGLIDYPSKGYVAALPVLFIEKAA